MTTQAAFPPEEWKMVLEGPPTAGIIVVTAARGGMFRETIAMAKPTRKPETLIMETIYRFSPMFAAEKFPVWLGGSEEDWGRCHVEGGDVQPIGADTVMMGMGERTTPQADVEELAAHAGVPVYNGLTDEWHPTQMLADFLAKDISGRTGARITITEDPAQAVAGADFIHTDVWVSMGEAKDVWAERVRLLAPYQVNADLMRKTRNPAARFMHCLPNFHDAKTVVGREIIEHTGMTSGLEVTDEVFRSPASIVFDQAENHLHTIKAVLVATLG
jgi:hypothetical protein